jgi:chromosomal replication initiator protein
MMGGASEINLELAHEALGKMAYSIKSSSQRNISSIQQAVCDYYKVSIEQLKSKRRTADITRARQIAMYLCRDLTENSYPKIGREFGGRDHTTVMHATNKITKLLESDFELRHAIDDLKQKIA